MQSRTFEVSMLEDLLRSHEAPCVSMTLPTDGVGKDALQATLRYRHLLEQAEQELPGGLDGESVAGMMAPLRQLLDDAPFWAAQDQGLAVYSAPGWMLLVRLPYVPPEQVQVADHFLLRPLVVLLGQPQQGYVLALSINRARVIEVTAQGGRELAIDGLPESMEEALGETQYYSEVNVHSGGPASLGRRGGVVHGHGDNDEERQASNLVAYFRRVSAALDGRLPASVPWVLAAVEEYYPLFRRASKDDARLLPEMIRGNPDALDPQQLAERARSLLESRGASEIVSRLQRFEREAGTPRVAVELSTIALAAHQGRVASLLVSPGVQYWGELDPDTGQLSVHSERKQGDVELVETTVFHTLKNGGEVLEVPISQLPVGDEMAALLRY